MSDISKPCPTCGIIESIVLSQILSLEAERNVLQARVKALEAVFLDANRALEIALNDEYWPITQDNWKFMNKTHTSVQRLAMKEK